MTALNLDHNRLKNLWPLVPDPAPTERDKVPCPPPEADKNDCQD